MNTSSPGRMPGGRGLFTSVFVQAVAEFSAWITVLVVAFDDGGSAAAGLAVLVQLVPAALLAPVVAAAGDRFARHRVLAASFAIQAIAAGGIMVALLGDAPLAVIYVFAAVFTVSTIPVPATIASLIVHHARTPSQLTRWNVTRSFVRASGSLLGPLLTALVLALAEPAAVFGGLVVGCAFTAALIAIRLPRDDRPPVTPSAARVLDDAWRGVVYVMTTPAPRRVVAFLGLTEMLVGALDLVFVALAFDQLGRDGAGAALLAVAFAAGSLLAALASSRLLAWQLSSLVTGGVVLLTVPLLMIGDTNLFSVTLALAMVLGAGNGLIEIGAQTLLQRSCAETMTSRAFGALDSTAMIAAAIGALGIGPVIDGSGLVSAAAALGAVGLVVLIVGALRMRATERALPSADPYLVACLRSVSFLEALPQPTLERLALLSELRSVASETDIVTEGEQGHEFYVLMSGAVEIRVGGETSATLVAPASFGEVALLHDDTRMATVTATEPCEVAVIDQGDFLDAVSRTATSRRDALAVAQRYRGPTGSN